VEGTSVPFHSGQLIQGVSMKAYIAAVIEAIYVKKLYDLADNAADKLLSLLCINFYVWVLSSILLLPIVIVWIVADGIFSTIIEVCKTFWREVSSTYRSLNDTEVEFSREVFLTKQKRFRK